MGRHLIEQNPARANAFMLDLLCKAANVDPNYVQSITCKVHSKEMIEFTIVKIGEPDAVLKAIEGAEDKDLRR